MSSLHNQVIRLAHANLEIRPHLLPLLREGAYEKLLHKPGETWRTPNGNWRAMNPDGVAKTFPGIPAAKAYAHGKGKEKSKEKKPSGDTMKLKEMVLSENTSADDITKLWSDSFAEWNSLDKKTKLSPDGKAFHKGVLALGDAVDAVDAFNKTREKLIRMGEDLDDPETDRGQDLKKKMDKQMGVVSKRLSTYNDHAKGYTGFKGKLKKIKDKATGIAQGLMQSLKGKKACEVFDRMASSKTASVQQDLVLVRRTIRVAYDKPHLRSLLVPLLVEHLCDLDHRRS